MYSLMLSPTGEVSGEAEGDCLPGGPGLPLLRDAGGERVENKGVGRSCS